MSNLSPLPPLNGYSRDWPEFSIVENYIGELVSVACVLGQEKVFAASFKKAFGKDLPLPQSFVKIKGGFAMWSGQEQYLLLMTEVNLQADKDIAKALNGSAYTTLQSDGWASLDLKGHRNFDVLERFIPLDLRSADDNYAARTSAHHISAIVIKFSASEIQLLTPRSSAQSFLDGLAHVAEHVLS